MQKFKKKLSAGFISLIFICLFLIIGGHFLSLNGSSPGIFSSISMLKEQHSFDAYTNDLFVQEMKENTINLHYTLTNPKDYGIKSHKISLGSLSKENREASIAMTENISAALSEFEYDALTTKQQLTWDILNDYCNDSLRLAPLYYYNEPLRPTTGTQSELPVLLAEYAFYQPSDVTDYLSLLTCIEHYFQQIALFEREKSKEGLFMPDYAAETVIEACHTFQENPKENYLIDTFNTRIDAMQDLSEEKKETYKQQNQSLIENSVIPAYGTLAETLSELKNSGTNDAGLCYFPQGKAYYEYLVHNYTGSDKTVVELKQCTERQRNLDMTALHTLLIQNPKLLTDNSQELAFHDPKEMLAHLSEAIQADFYPAANDSCEVNYVHPSLEETLAPAFYLTAPIDDISHNVIYINQSSQYSGIQLFTTLAHEGYPGHLYQTTGSYQAGLAPVRALFNYPGYVEGWATYVEMLSYQYAGLSGELAEMLMRNQSALLSLYATIDMGIHYDGWKLADTAAFLYGYNITDGDVIQNIYELVVEEPAHYLKYYIGYLEFLELKEYAKNELGDTYSDRAFHQAVIRIGPAPFSLLKKYLRDFYTAEQTTNT